MDKNRWIVVASVVCMMIVTLGLLQRFYGDAGAASGDPEGLVVESGARDPSQVAEDGRRASRSGTAARAAIVLTPPPAHFFAISSPEEDLKGVQNLLARGKAIRPETFVASRTTGTAPREERR